MRLSDKTKEYIKNTTKFLAGFAIFGIGIMLVWVSTFDIPDINSFTNRQVQQSTKIYDKTGEIVLYDLNEDVRRTKVPLDEISRNLMEATIAIEDGDFYTHHGIDPSAIVRAMWTNLKNFEFAQGGSTITQQVVKNTLLTPKKTISRKVKEWVLAIRLDAQMEKNEILEIYLNETPYGGRVYGAEEAADRYFGKSAADLSIPEAAYLAALPKAPTFYSPYGNNREALDNRKNEVLREMRSNGFITDDEFQQAISKDVTFMNQQTQSIRAPHFVFHIKEYLEEEYGTSAIERRGLKITTTLNYDLQQAAENIVGEYGAENAERFNASNAALTAVDPKTGQILAMVGSRDYQNDEIQGNFNAATAERQPGSAFKPFVYATALKKGYTDKTTIFDLPTQFSTNCSPSKYSSDDGCFGPVNYDGKFRGPITFREALAQSVNVPAVKALYLAGLEDSLDTARSMGINTLDKQPDRYGLSLVLGSGEVTLLDMTSAYGVFANDGVKQPHTGILKIEDAEGEVLEKFEEQPERVLEGQTARMMNDMLSDNVARTPAFGPNSPLHFPDADVAAKTGTTNEYKDLWTVGYNPNIAVGVWAGNNNGDSVDGEVAGYVVAPMWQEFMQEALDELETGSFTEPGNINYSDLKPALQGFWRGGYFSGNDGNQVLLPGSEGRRGLSGGVHNILHWVNKNNPRGPAPSSPESDPQYRNWEYSVRQWVRGNEFNDIDSEISDPDDVSNSEGGEDFDDMPNGNFIELTTRLEGEYGENEKIRVTAENNGELDRLELYINGEMVDDDDSQPYSISVDIKDIPSINIDEMNVLTVRGFSNNATAQEINHSFTISE